MQGLEKLTRAWVALGPRFLPFGDSAAPDLPLGRLLRLSLFQVTVGMALALLIGTLNRVMIVELRVPAWLVALMIGLPLVFAPFRAFIGFRSDHHRSVLGWRRVPFIWFGTMVQWAGLAIMPFALLVLSGTGQAPVWIGQVAAALAILLVGAGLQTTQTAGLALATDLAAPAARPRVVALMYVMLLVGMVTSGLAFSAALVDFTPLRLIQVIQGAAVVTMVLNVVALWQQEKRDPNLARDPTPPPQFRAAWAEFVAQPNARRFLWTIALGTLAFNMQDVVLEPYGGEVLGLPVAATSMLTALLAGGSLVAFGISARLLGKGLDAYRLAAWGVMVGVVAFALLILSAPFASPALFRAGTLLIGFGSGLFAVGTLIAAMGLDRHHAQARSHAGLALGAWGAVQATAAGAAMAFGGALRDVVGDQAMHGTFGAVLQSPATGYSAVYHLELFLMFATLVAIGPLVRLRRAGEVAESSTFELVEMPR